MAQSKIGLTVLQLEMRRLGFEMEKLFGDDVAKDGIAFLYETDSQEVSVIQRLRAMWTEMGDYLSR